MAYTQQVFENGHVLEDKDLNLITKAVADNSQVIETGFLGDGTLITATWEQGAINSQTGEDASMTTRVRTDYIAVEKEMSISVGNTGAEFCPTYYDSSKTFISCPGVYQTTDLTISSSDCAYVRLMARDKNNTSNILSASYGSNVTIYSGQRQRMIYTASEIDSMIGGSGGSTAASGLAGKKIVFLGDSIPHGQTTSGSIEIPYPQVVAANLGMTLKNYGIGGSTIAQQTNYGGAFKTKAELDAATKDTSKYYQVINGQSYQTYGYSNGSWTTASVTLRTPITARYDFMDDDAEVICVHCTTNDWNYDWTELGDFSSTSVNTYYGALKQLIENLIAKYPTKTIIFITPLKRAQDPYNQPDSKNANGKTLKEYRDILIEVCEYYGIPVIDLWAISGLNPYLASQVDLFDRVKTHPLTVGHKKMGDIVSSQILAIRRFVTA